MDDVGWIGWLGEELSRTTQRDIEPLAVAGVAGFKCFLVHPGIDGFTMVTEQQLRAALPHVARTGLPLLVHAELPGPIDAAAESLADADWSLYQTYLQSRPEEAELSAIRLLLSLCREYKFRLHIVHLSASKALAELRAARSEGLPVSVETCPHYLHLTAETIPEGATLFKCAPPIRSRENREKLWQGLRDGAIDLVATDHSPCPPEMKRLAEGNFRSAWGGIASLSVALAGDAHRGQQSRICADRYRALDGRGSGKTGWLREAERPNCSGIRRRLCRFRSGERVCRDARIVCITGTVFLRILEKSFAAW